MYTNWDSLKKDLESSVISDSVLFHFPSNVGKDVVNNIIKSLIVLNNNSEIHIGKSHKNIQWIMEVICFGLYLPLIDIETIKNCSILYETWLMNIHSIDETLQEHYNLPIHPSMNSINCSLNAGSIFIPQVILLDPIKYSCLIVEQLKNIFFERSSLQNVSLQSQICEKILYILRKISSKGGLSPELWSVILKFHLGIATRLLIPIKMNQIGNSSTTTQSTPSLPELLCGPIINNLFCTWILACKDNYFPEPVMWATLVDVCICCRHRSLVVHHWSLVISLLTRNVMDILVDPNSYQPLLYISLKNIKVNTNKNPPSKLKLLINEEEIIIHLWFRFLHILGNLAELTNVQKVLEYSLSNKAITASDLLENNLINVIANNFLKAMRAISQITSLLLRDIIDSSIVVEHWVNEKTNYAKTHTSHTLLTGQIPNSQVVNNVVSTSSVKIKSSTTRIIDAHNIINHQMTNISSNETSNNNLQTTEKNLEISIENLLQTSNNFEKYCVVHWDLPLNRIIENKIKFTEATTILKLFSKWLFGVFDDIFKPSDNLNKINDILYTFYKNNIKSYQKTFKELYLGNDFESGKAVAIGILCRVFSHKKTSKRISIEYLSMFYPLICFGLIFQETKAPLITLSIISNCRHIFINNLSCISATIPYFLSAFENFFNVDYCNQTGIEFINNNLSILNELRSSSYTIISNLICYPLHFLHKVIPYIFPISKNHQNDLMTNSQFFYIRNRLITLLLNGLETTENDTATLYLIVSTIVMCIYDSKVFLDTIDKNSTVYMELLNDEISFIRIFYLEVITRITARIIHISRNKTLDLSAILCLLEGLTSFFLVDKRITGNMPETRKLIIWICNYISLMALRPSPMHSKDLHSILVASYNFLTVWVGEHPSILDEKSCLEALINVIELGLTGSNSKSENQTILMDKKEIKPVSLRVKEAADFLLSIITDFTNFNINRDIDSIFNCGHNENTLSKIFGKSTKDFTYYSINDYTLLSILDISNETTQSTVLLLRCPSGKHAFKMTYQHSPSSHEKIHLETMKPFIANNKPHVNISNTVHKHSYNVENIQFRPKCKLDEYPPSFNKILQDIISNDIEKHKNSLKAQIIEENNAFAQYHAFCTSEKSMKPLKSLPPISQPIKNSCRLLLSNLGILNNSCALVDGQNGSFMEEIQLIDQLSTKFNEKIFVFISRQNQTDPQEIFNNKIEESKPDCIFADFLESLGMKTNEYSPLKMLFFSDITTNVSVFVAPWMNNTYRHSCLLPTISINKSSSFEKMSVNSDSRVIVVWVEDFSSVKNFPLNELLELCSGDLNSSLELTANQSKLHLLLFIEPLVNELYHVHSVLSNGTIYNQYPLPCSSLISRRILPTMIRQTSMSFFLKKRLNIESFAHPHSARKLAIQKICRKYKIFEDIHSNILNGLCKSPTNSQSSLLSLLNLSASEDYIPSSIDR